MFNVQLRKQLSTSLNKHLKSAVASAMGYKVVSEGFISRLNRVLTDDLLGLDAGGYDFKHSDESFLRALCELANIEAILVDEGITAAYERVEHRKHAFRPSLFVDTGFKRKTEPVFVLAMSEGLRRLTWPLSFVDLSETERLAAACSRVIEHYTESDGELQVWGRIQFYIYHHLDRHALVIDVKGNIVDKVANFMPDSASLSIRGKPVNSICLKAAEDADASPAADSIVH